MKPTITRRLLADPRWDELTPGQRARRLRNLAMAQLHQCGWSAHLIAEVVGLDPSRVQRIIGDLRARMKSHHLRIIG